MNRTVYQPNPMCGCSGSHGIHSSQGSHGNHVRVPVQKMPCSHANSGTAHVSPVPCQTEQAQNNMCEHAMPDCVLAMAYVHVQSLGTLYDPCTALIAGTLFPDLDKPFCGETISATAYPTPPARTCDCALPMRRDGMGCGVRGGVDRG